MRRAARWGLRRRRLHRRQGQGRNRHQEQDRDHESHALFSLDRRSSLRLLLEPGLHRLHRRQLLLQQPGNGAK